MSTLTLNPEGSFVSGDSDPHTHVPIDRMTEHPLLRLARIDDNRLTWPGLQNSQRGAVKDVYLDGGYAVLPSRINFDLLVDESTGGFSRVAALDDIQRFYTRFTTNMLLHIGTFTALTRGGVRRYFLWQSGKWSELGVDMYLHYRDGDFQFFTETPQADIERLDPGAVDTDPVPTTSENIEEGE